MLAITTKVLELVNDQLARLRATEDLFICRNVTDALYFLKI